VPAGWAGSVTSSSAEPVVEELRGEPNEFGQRERSHDRVKQRPGDNACNGEGQDAPNAYREAR